MKLSVFANDSSFDARRAKARVFGLDLPCRVATVLILGAFGVQAVDCVSPPVGVVSWWRGESNTVDWIGNNDGIPTGDLTFDNGRVNQGFIFNGSTAALDVPASPSLDVGAGNGFTIEGWIRPTDLSVNRYLMGWYSSPNRYGVEMWLSFPSEGYLSAWLPPTQVFWTTGQLVANEFQHIALTYDAPSGIAKILRNGVVSVSTNLGTFRPVTSYDFHLARRPDDGRSFKGAMDEVAVYNRSLSELEVRDIFMRGAAGKCVNNPPLITEQPMSQPALVGSTATLSVSATGVTLSGYPLSYQWLFNGTNIANATNRFLTVANAQFTNSGIYSVRVSNSHGSVVSSNAILTVRNPGGPGEVVVCDLANFLAAIASGERVTFACGGNLVLTNALHIHDDTVIDATGYEVKLSGNNATRHFVVDSGIKLTLIGLTLADGAAIGTNGAPGLEGESIGGGAILNNGGAVCLFDCTFTNNSAKGGTGGNLSSPPWAGNGGKAVGGAICSLGGSLVLSNCMLLRNNATGGNGGSSILGGEYGDGAPAQGGAIYASNAQVSIIRGELSLNYCLGGESPFNLGSTGAGGSAHGGALCIVGGTGDVTEAKMESNSAMGRNLSWNGPTPGSAYGGAAYFTGAVVRLTGTTFIRNVATGGMAPRNNAAAGVAYGGAVCNIGALDVRANYFQDNRASGGIGVRVPGASGQGGGLYNAGTVVLDSSALVGNSAIGGNGGFSMQVPATPGGPGSGGGVHNAGTLQTTNCTFALNLTRGGESGGNQARGGMALGGAMFHQSGTAAFCHGTVASNLAVGGRSFNQVPQGESLGGGITSSNSGLRLQNSILAFNTSGSNCFGPLIDDGNNISSDASCPFTAAGSLSNTDPGLSPLDDFGGPTPTMALLAGSPAIDHALSSFCPATDQRGRSRPHGAACDVGAFESAPPFSIRGRIRGYMPNGGIPVYAGLTSTVSSASGTYILWDLPIGSYTVAPSLPSLIALPNTRTISVGPDVLNVDFQSYQFNALTAESYSNHVVHLVFAGTNALTYEVQTSTNLVNWLAYSTNMVGSDSVFHLFHTNIPPEPARFFSVLGR